MREARGVKVTDRVYLQRLQVRSSNFRIYQIFGYDGDEEIMFPLSDKHDTMTAPNVVSLKHARRTSLLALETSRAALLARCKNYCRIVLIDR